MGIVEIILLGIGLAMDCFAVSLSKGVAAKRVVVPGAVIMAVLFGVFQAGMPLVGYFAGVHFADLIGRVAPWVALALLGFIGGKMVYEHFSDEHTAASDEHTAASDEHSDATAAADYRLRTVLILSVATSIDALATGLIFVDKPQTTLWLAIAVIGICSFIFSLAGTLIGVFVGSKFRFPAELVGGLILIGIGLKIWIEGILL